MPQHDHARPPDLGSATIAIDQIATSLQALGRALRALTEGMTTQFSMLNAKVDQVSHWVEPPRGFSHQIRAEFDPVVLENVLEELSSRFAQKTADLITGSEAFPRQVHKPEPAASDPVHAYNFVEKRQAYLLAANGRGTSRTGVAGAHPGLPGNDTKGRSASFASSEQLPDDEVASPMMLETHPGVPCGKARSEPASFVSTEQLNMLEALSPELPGVHLGCPGYDDADGAPASFGSTEQLQCAQTSSSEASIRQPCAAPSDEADGMTACSVSTDDLPGVEDASPGDEAVNVAAGRPAVEADGESASVLSSEQLPGAEATSPEMLDSHPGVPGDEAKCESACFVSTEQLTQFGAKAGETASFVSSERLPNAQTSSSEATAAHPGPPDDEADMVTACAVLTEQLPGAEAASLVDLGVTLDVSGGAAEEETASFVSSEQLPGAEAPFPAEFGAPPDGRGDKGESACFVSTEQLPSAVLAFRAEGETACLGSTEQLPGAVTVTPASGKGKGGSAALAIPPADHQVNVAGWLNRLSKRDLHEFIASACPCLARAWEADKRATGASSPTVLRKFLADNLVGHEMRLADGSVGIGIGLDSSCACGP